MSSDNDSTIERETLRRGWLTLETAAHEESFCVWHLVRSLNRNNADASTESGPVADHALIDAHGRAAIRGAQVTNGMWVVLAKLARVVVCGPDDIPADELARRNPSYYRRLRELQAAFILEKASLDRYCAAYRTTPLFEFAPGGPSSQDLLTTVQRGADRCAHYLDDILHVNRNTGVDVAAWKTRTALLVLTTALDMASAAGSFLDVVSAMVFGHGVREPPSRPASVPPQRRMPLVVPNPAVQRPASLPPDSLPKATATATPTATPHMAEPSSSTSIGEQAVLSGTPPRRHSVPAWPLPDDFVDNSPEAVTDNQPPLSIADADHDNFAGIHMIDHQKLVDASNRAVPQTKEEKSMLRRLFTRKKK